MLYFLVFLLVASISANSRKLNDPCVVSSKYCNDALVCLPTKALSKQGICSQKGKEGTVCEWTETCMNGLVCRPKDMYSASKFCLPMPKSGEPCVSNYDCQEGGSRCIIPNSIASSKICIKRGILGEQCDSSQYCDTGLSCQNVEANYSICLPFSSEGISCSSSEDCSFNYVCRTNEKNTTHPNERFCMEKEMKEEGQTCGNENMCLAGLVCRNNTHHSGVTTCQKPSELGGACTANSDCKDFDKGRLCSKLDDVRGVCKSWGDFGDSCDSRYSECYPQFTCRSVGNTRSSYGNRICTYRGEKGESCSSKIDCAGNLKCRFHDASSRALICSDYGSLEQGCLETADCQGNLRCRKKTATDYFTLCLEPGKEAEVCTADEDCDDLLICRKDNKSLNRVCSPRGNAGENCQTNKECAEGLFCNAEEKSGQLNVCEELRNIGEECIRTSDCASGLTCTPSSLLLNVSTCSDAGKDGDVCFWKNGNEELYSSCEEGLNCMPFESESNQTELRICKQRKSNLLEPCIVSEHCADGLVCRKQKPQLRSSCLLKGKRGEMCHPSEDGCEEGLMCRQILSAELALCLSEGAQPEICGEQNSCGTDSFCHKDLCVRIKE